MQGLSRALASGKDVKLSADIDCSGSEWTPVGTEENPFVGTLDGNGYKISNLTISNAECAALIAEAGENVTIKNLVLENVNINSTTYAAGVVFEAKKGLKIENVKVSGTISSAYTGGIVGWSGESANIANVINNASIEGTEGAAGIAYNFGGEIKNAINEGEVVSNGSAPAGGIVAVQGAASTYEYCFNYGDVKTIVDNVNSSAAGILGHTPASGATINYCANYGNITAEQSYAAGIACSLYGGIAANYCYNNGAINGKYGAGAIAPKPKYGSKDNAKNCLNAGTITSDGKTYQGANNNESCYYYSGNSLLNVSNNEIENEREVLQTLNGGTDTSFFAVSSGKISVVR